MNIRYMVAFGLLFAAFQIYQKENANTPTPEARELDLRGKFVGPDAAEDAAILSTLSDELASEIEWDGTQSNPYLKTGVDFDELRTTARDIRCRGECLGDKHPKVRTAVATYLNEKVGVSGGPISPAERANWVAAYREIAKAAADATR